MTETLRQATDSAKGTRLLHSIPTVAYMLDCSVATVWRLIAAKKLETVKIGPNGGLTRVTEQSLQAMLSDKAA